MPRTRFSPLTHGWQFANTFKTSATRISEFLPDIHYRGLCGGMVYSALDYFNAGVAIPDLNYRPLVGSSFEGFIFSRQQDSTINSQDNINRWLELQLNFGGVRNAEFFSWGIGSRLAELIRYIDNGTPVPLGLKGTGDQDHQVLAIGYNKGRYAGDGGRHVEDIKIYLYDPNYPGVETVMLADPNRKVFYYDGIKEKTWQAYFVDSAYRAHTPPPTREPTRYPDDNQAHEVHVEITTGGDDLRGRNDNVSLELRFAGNRIRNFPNVNHSQRWIDNNAERVVLRLPAFAPESLKAVTMRTSFGGGIGGDNWNVDELRIFLLVNNEYVLVHQNDGAPLVRFTGDNVPYTALLRVPGSGDRVDEILVLCRTGGDDLRGGNDNVHATLHFSGGRREQMFLNINERRRWPNNSWSSSLLVLDRPTRLDELRSLTLQTTFGGGFGGDNWNLDALRVITAETDLYYGEGRPLVRFDGNNRPFEVILNGRGVGLKPGDKVLLEHIETGARLHSHPFNYKHPQTSGQQHVTAYYQRDSNDGWEIKVGHGESTHYDQFKDGDIIRLTHIKTQRNLHSHRGFPAPISDRQQEVTAFGGKGVGDSNDNWRLELVSGATLTYGATVRLIHVNTNVALHSHNYSSREFLGGQQEITGYSGRDNNDLWRFLVSPYLDD